MMQECLSQILRYVKSWRREDGHFVWNREKIKKRCPLCTRTTLQVWGKEVGGRIKIPSTYISQKDVKDRRAREFLTLLECLNNVEEAKDKVEIRYTSVNINSKPCQNQNQRWKGVFILWKHGSKFCSSIRRNNRLFKLQVNKHVDKPSDGRMIYGKPTKYYQRSCM